MTDRPGGGAGNGPPSPIRFRVARPTDRLDELRAYYCDIIGLEEIGSFRDHDGYNGVMIGPPGRDYHLEFTSHENGSPCPPPSRDNLLVFYMESEAEVAAVAGRLARAGHDPVEPENPYWKARALTYEDPDGWRVVFMALEST